MSVRGAVQGITETMEFFIQKSLISKKRKTWVWFLRKGLSQKTYKMWISKAGFGGFFSYNFCDAICKCLKSKDLLPWTWALQRCCILWEHQPLWPQDQGPVPLALSRLLGSAAHCSGVSPVWIWCNKCSEHKCLIEHESKIGKRQQVVLESSSETDQSLAFCSEARL